MNEGGKICQYRNTYPIMKLTHFGSSDETDEKTLVKILLKNYNEE